MKSEITTIDPSSISTAELHSILLTAVAPRPIAFASTVNANGNVNLSPFSFFNVFSANPPILIFSPARRVKNNTTKHTLENVKSTKEVVINIVNFPIVEQMSLSSTEYDIDINEFIKSGLTPIKSVKITPPRVAESPVSFECVVDNIIELGKEGGAGNLVISRVVCIHINNKYLDTNGNLDTKKLDLVARMGGSWYARLIEESLFEIPKPIFNQGIGVDSLPKHALNSTILTGNNLGRLGNLPKTPSSKEIEKIKKTAILTTILAIKDKTEKENQLHSVVKKLLNEDKLEQALSVLFCL
ncbi:flavin reductase family protein [Lutibacter sp.]|uniref:flavin reductase family protein n=1 Tax=Lutibacter sp. TaxID=1925666 RepID=UPI0034A09CBA